MSIGNSKDEIQEENQIIVTEGKFWLPNRLYKLVLQNEKIYGIWIGGQFNYLNNEQTLYYFKVFFGIFLFNPIYILVFANYNNLFNSFLSIFGFILTLVITDYLLNFLIERLVVPSDFWQNIVAKARNKSNQLFQKSVEFITKSGEKDEEFVKQNNKNFIFKKSEITKIEINREYNRPLALI